MTIQKQSNKAMFYFLTINNISLSWVGQKKKINGPHIAPWAVVWSKRLLRFVFWSLCYTNMCLIHKSTTKNHLLCCPLTLNTDQHQSSTSLAPQDKIHLNCETAAAALLSVWRTMLKKTLCSFLSSFFLLKGIFEERGPNKGKMWEQPHTQSKAASPWQIFAK